MTSLFFRNLLKGNEASLPRFATTTRLAPGIVSALLILTLPVFAQDEVLAADDVQEGASVSEEPFPDSTLEGEVLEVTDNPDLSETTVIDLEALINLPASARLRREADENAAQPNSVFDNAEVRARYLGEKPRFVYIPKGVDPMIIPWIRERIVVGELIGDAQNEFDAAKRESTKDLQIAAATKVLRKVEGIAAEYPSNNRLADIQKMADDIRAYLLTLTSETPDDGRPEKPVIAREIQLPTWVRENTRGIIIDPIEPEKSIALVGDLILRQGDVVERFPAVRVKSIQERRVIFEFQQTEHVVLVETN
jgi:hypothetical protein